MAVFRHKHEIETGRTSSISQHLLGYDSHGRVINYGGVAAPAMADIAADACKVRHPPCVTPAHAVTSSSCSNRLEPSSWLIVFTSWAIVPAHRELPVTAACTVQHQISGLR